MWDVTCVDTHAPSHLSGLAGYAATAAAEALKRRKYINLTDSYIFEPFGLEMLGSWVGYARFLFSDQMAGLFFGQRSIAMQLGNAASLQGTLPVDSDVEEYFDALALLYLL